MKRAYVAVAGVVCLVATAVLADFTVASSSATWTHYTVSKLPDAGIHVELCGYALKSNGERTEEKCDSGDVTGTARTNLTNIGDTILSRWKTARGL